MAAQTIEERCYKALYHQNYGVNPFEARYLEFRSAYVVGDKIFLAREAAQDWIDETRGESVIITYNYRELYPKYHKDESNI